MYLPGRNLILTCITIAGMLIPYDLHAQETTQEFWPEIDTWYRASPSWRFSLFLPLSKNIETKYREGNIILQADYSFGKNKQINITRLVDEDRAQQLKTFMVRGGYLSGRSLDDKGLTYSENTLFTELHARIPVKGNILISHRLRTDFRWLGEERESSARIRYRIMVEKEIKRGKVSNVWYFNTEPYYDTRYSEINRIRIIGGCSVQWKSLFALEGNITYQHDTKSSVTDLYALNIILHLFFERKVKPSLTSQFLSRASQDPF
jgi:Protein of unknown function (DUF2490)